MKRILKTTLGMHIAAMFLTAALSNSATADEAVPLRGTLRGVLENVVVQFPALLVQGSDTGEATHLGRFDASWEEAVNLINNIGVGSGRFVAANGDSLFYDFIGEGASTELPNQVSVVETAVITGGTGRFTGATGSFMAELLVDLGAGVTTGSFRGTLVLGRNK